MFSRPHGPPAARAWERGLRGVVSVPGFASGAAGGGPEGEARLAAASSEGHADTRPGGRLDWGTLGTASAGGFRA